jgi:hypothetical protein
MLIIPTLGRLTQIPSQLGLRSKTLCLKKKKKMPSMEENAYNPSNLGGGGRRIMSLRPVLAT